MSILDTTNNENTKKERVEFYGGFLGAWLPIIVMVVGLIIGTIIGGGGILRFSLVTVLCMFLGFLLAKDKKAFGNIAVAGIRNNMLAIIILAFILAGLLSQLLRQSGLINGLIWLASLVDFNAGLIPLICFLICVLISTSCGTSSGAVAAVCPVMLPLGVSLGCDPGLVCAAVVSGAIFGDNLAPISDTTIASALTQGAQVGDVVKTRLPYSLIAGGISAVLFVVFGLSTTEGNAVESLTLDSSDAKALVLLVLPVIMVIMMKKGWDLVATLIVCNIAGIVLDLALGCISPSVMFSNEGPIVAGMSGMMNLLLYIMILFILLEILTVSGAFDVMVEWLSSKCKGPRSAELVCMLAVAISTIAAGGSAPAIMFCGPMVRKMTKKFKIERTRGSNIMDGTACGISGLLPYGSCVMLCLGFAADMDGIEAGFSFADIIPYNFHSIFLLLLFILSIVTGIGRRTVTEEEAE